jgi:general secretion pathway protein H
MSATGNDAGTTLLELLVVMGLLALLTTLTFPALERSLDLFEMRQTAGVLESNLRLVRSDAVRSGQAIAFTVSSDGKSYAWSEGEVRQMPNGTYVRTANGHAIEFYGDGTTSGGAVIASTEDRRIAVDVDAATGTVTPGQ